MKGAKTILVKECCECPLTQWADHYEHSVYQCLLDKQLKDIKSGTIVPPENCALRNLIVTVIWENK